MPEAIQNLLYSLSNADGNRQIGGTIIAIAAVLVTLSSFWRLRTDDAYAEPFGDWPAPQAASTAQGGDADTGGGVHSADSFSSFVVEPE